MNTTLPSRAAFERVALILTGRLVEDLPDAHPGSIGHGELPILARCGEARLIAVGIDLGAGYNGFDRPTRFAIARRDALDAHGPGLTDAQVATMGEGSRTDETLADFAARVLRETGHALDTLPDVDGGEVLCAWGPPGGLAVVRFAPEGSPDGPLAAGVGVTGRDLLAPDVEIDARDLAVQAETSDGFHLLAQPWRPGFGRRRLFVEDYVVTAAQRISGLRGWGSFRNASRGITEGEAERLRAAVRARLAR